MCWVESRARVPLQWNPTENPKYGQNTMVIRRQISLNPRFFQGTIQLLSTFPILEVSIGVQEHFPRIYIIKWAASKEELICTRNSSSADFWRNLSISIRN
jgi:hypothetical protein